MKRPGSNLRTTLIAGALAPLVIAGILQATYSVVSQREEAMAGLAEKARAVAKLLVDVAGPSMATDDPAGAEEGLGFAAGDPDFQFAVAAGPDGKVVAYRGAIDMRTRAAAAVHLSRTPTIAHAGDTLIASYPVVSNDRQLGELVVGMRTSQVLTDAAHRTAWATLISLVGIAIAIAVVLVLAGRIVRKNTEMNKLLASIDQGVLRMDRDGTLAVERSAMAIELLGEYRLGQKLWDALSPHDPDFAAWLELAWSSVIEGFMPLELTLTQLPARLQIGDRHYRIEYKPTVTGDTVSDCLVVITDKTAELARERAEASERDLLRLIERVARDRVGFREFVHETDRLVRRIEEMTNADDELKRDVHTLKGNCAMFGLTSVAEHCHELEDRMHEGELDAGMKYAITECWHELKTKLERLLGTTDDGRVDISTEDLSELRTAISAGAKLSTIERIVGSWSLERTRPRLERFGDQARALSTRLGKPPVDVSVADHGVRLDPDKFRPFWTALLHVVRNAVDHGIEGSETRVGAGKPAHGRLSLTSRRDGEVVIIEIADDGRGIDWDAVRESAREAGRPHATERDLVDAILSEGVTTRTEVTETSGRGVGLAAVRQICSELGGEIAVTTRRGQGTTFQFRFRGARSRTPSMGVVA